MPEVVIVAVLVLTVAQAAVADAEKVAVVADTVVEAAVVADAKVVAVVVSVIFPANAVKIAAEAMPAVVHAVKVATDADASN